MAQQEHQTAGRIDSAYVERLSKSFNEPTWLREFRISSLREYFNVPEEQSNLYSKYALDLNVDAESVAKRMSLPSVSPAAQPMRELAEGIESSSPYFIGTMTEVIASKNIKKLESSGVIFCDLNEALEKHEPILRKIFGMKAIKPQDDKFAALNNALFSSAWLIYVPRNTQLEDALRLRFYLNSERPHFSQTWIVAEENSTVTLLTESYGAEIPGLASEIVESYIDNNSSIHYSNIEDYSDQTTVLANKKAVCGKDGRVIWTLAYFGGRVIRARLESVFEKDGASAEDVEVVFGNKNQQFDLVSDLTHNAPSTKGRILANSVLKDKSKSVFKGMIRIGKDAKNASAYLAGHAILLSPDAKSDAIPGLEILTNEVKATHSASVAQIDLEQIFYMMTRGLSEDESKKFIVLGFLEPAISRISSEDLRDTIRDLVESKWYGATGLIKKKKHEVLFEEEAIQEKPRDIFEGHYKYR